MAKPVLALVPVILVKNQKAECIKFLDTYNPILNLKIYIRSRSMTVNERIRLLKEKKIMI